MAKGIYVVNLAALTVMGYTSGVQAASAAGEGDVIAYESDGFKALTDEQLLALYNKAAEVGEGSTVKSLGTDREKTVKKMVPVMEYLASLTPAKSPAPRAEGEQQATQSEKPKRQTRKRQSKQHSTAGEGQSAATTDGAQGAQDENMATSTKSTKRAARKAAAKKTGRKAAARKAAASNGEGRRGRLSRFAGMRITRQQKENPRREGTRAYKAWELIRDGMTYEDYMAKGGNLEDLTREWERKRVKISK